MYCGMYIGRSYVHSGRSFRFIENKYPSEVGSSSIEELRKDLVHMYRRVHAKNDVTLESSSHPRTELSRQTNFKNKTPQLLK